MARMWIVVGDMTSSGGRVISGSPFTDIDGKSVSRVNDQATCPLHKGVFHIVDGDVTMIVDGQPVALHGSSLACGCKVLAVQQSHVFVDAGGGSDAAAMTSSAASLATGAAKELIAENAAFDRYFVLKNNQTGKLLAGIPYRITLEDGSELEGISDDQGTTQKIAAATALKATIKVFV